MAKKYASLDTLRTFLENLKTHFASTTEIDEIKEAKADWNQNDETAIDYVKNRTHYEDMYCDTVNGVYQSSTESLCCSISGIDLANGGSLTLQAEESGVRYNFSIDPSSVSTGTTEGVTTFGEYTVNFKKMINRQNGKYICSFLILPYSETMTATATYSYLLDVKQLDEKFIPDTIARTTDIESTYATKTDLENIDLSAYETAENAQLKFDEAKAYADTVASGKANTSHTHDDRYYTETEVDSKLAGKADKTHNHDSVYDTKGSADTALASAKTYTDTKTSGLASTSSVNTSISNHNTSTSAHNDIRDLITGLTNRLNTLANSDDTTLDQMSEVVAYIKNNKSLIDGITTSKVNVSDIVNNLTTNVSNKPLSAAQGVTIKALIDNLQAVVDTKASSSVLANYYTKTEIDNYELITTADIDNICDSTN